MKIGIMGGTFDPVHNGHLNIAKEAKKQFHLDEIWFLPNGNPPHKTRSSIVSDIKERTAMINLAIMNEKDFKLNLYEANKNEVSYTYETLTHLKESYPKHSFYFVLGADSLFDFENWVHPEIITRQCVLLAAYRDDIDTREAMYVQINHLQQLFNADIRLLKTPIILVSSHNIREILWDTDAYTQEEDTQIRDMLPKQVYTFIKENHLYERRKKSDG